MSIRIQNEAITGSSASEVSRSEDIARSGANGGNRVSGADPQNRDRVELSGLSDVLSNALDVSKSQHSEKVRQLAALHASGRYTVDSMRVSHAIVSEAIGSGTAKSGMK